MKTFSKIFVTDKTGSARIQFIPIDASYRLTPKSLKFQPATYEHPAGLQSASLQRGERWAFFDYPKLFGPEPSASLIISYDNACVLKCFCPCHEVSLHAHISSTDST